MERKTFRKLFKPFKTLTAQGFTGFHDVTSQNFFKKGVDNMWPQAYTVKCQKDIGT